MKYRIPILQRTPFVRRIPVLEREPVIRRTSVFHRKAVTSVIVEYSGCGIKDRYADCNGCTYCKPGVDNPDKNTVLIVIDDILDDWKPVLFEIAHAKNNKDMLRIVTEVPLPSEILYEIGYSPFNVIQYNLDMYMGSGELSEFKHSMMTASNCGLYIVALLYPMLPGVVRVYNIIELLDSFKNICRHVCLKFIEISEPIKPINGFYNVNGEPVPEWTLAKSPSGILICSDLYADKFIDSLKRYVVPRKINVSICNQKVCY